MTFSPSRTTSASRLSHSSLRAAESDLDGGGVDGEPDFQIKRTESGDVSREDGLRAGENPTFLVRNGHKSRNSKKDSKMTGYSTVRSRGMEVGTS